jgi:hypothetical protein
MLKSRATRYIAAAEEAWLYPERQVSTTEWSNLDRDWFLFPHPYKVSFGREILMGFGDGSSWRQDEYGRRPSNPRFKDEGLRRKEWERHLRAQEEWAKRRLGRSVAHIHPSDRTDAAADRLMQKYLEEQGLIPTNSTNETPQAQEN